MKVSYDIKNYSKVYDVLVTSMGICQDAFLADDAIEIDWKDFQKLKDELYDISFFVDEDSLSLKERLFEAAEKLGWSCVEDEEGGVDFRQASPAGEDFGFYIHPGDDIVDETIDYSNSFDVDEHIEMWVEAKRNGVAGVPSIRELVKDADEIAEMLETLAEAFADVQRKHYSGETSNDEASDDVNNEDCDNGCTKIFIVVEDGIVQEVYCSDMNAEVCIEDHDAVPSDKYPEFWLDGSVINKDKLTQLY